MNHCLTNDKGVFIFSLLRTETSDLYSWLFIHSSCLSYALNSLNREFLFSKCFVQVSNELLILCNLLRITRLAHSYFENIFLKCIWKGEFFHDLMWVPSSQYCQDVTSSSLSYRSCTISTKMPLQLCECQQMGSTVYRDTNDSESWHCMGEEPRGRAGPAPPSLRGRAGPAPPSFRAYYKLPVFKTE